MKRYKKTSKNPTSQHEQKYGSGTVEIVFVVEKKTGVYRTAFRRVFSLTQIIK